MFLYPITPGSYLFIYSGLNKNLIKHVIVERLENDEMWLGVPGVVMVIIYHKIYLTMKANAAIFSIVTD